MGHCVYAINLTIMTRIKKKNRIRYHWTGKNRKAGHFFFSYYYTYMWVLSWSVQCVSNPDVNQKFKSRLLSQISFTEHCLFRGLKPLIVKRNLAKDDEIRENYSVLILLPFSSLRKLISLLETEGKKVSALWRKIKSALDKKLVWAHTIISNEPSFPNLGGISHWPLKISNVTLRQTWKEKLF